ncbi:MAG: hypothetical protein JO168_17110 [Solirubrobacterales bacterium]|nr:hypothetical protein [Solirubrobacterales bacterium]
MSKEMTPRGVHLVGSVPLGSADEVFKTVARHLGHHVRRIPDGETGDRQQWVQFQLGVLGSRPEFELIENPAPGWENLPPTLKLREGVSPDDVDFSGLGYARVASESHARFAWLQDEGTIPAGVRFQVSMPTPPANATAWMQFDPQFPMLFERYTQAMLDELDALLAAIPHEHLAIQWDVCFEVLMFEGWMPMPAGVDRQAIADHLVRISNVVPPAVELGYHFCFGDFGHVHMREPEDTGRVVELIGSFIGRVSRPVHWVHIPVPIERDDPAYFEPLRQLELPDDTELYLGLVHYRDGVEGARRRIATARRYVPAFGVATECGMGRRPPERGGAEDTLARLLDIHAGVAEPVISGATT